MMILIILRSRSRSRPPAGTCSCWVSGTRKNYRSGPAARSHHVLERIPVFEIDIPVRLRYVGDLLRRRIPDEFLLGSDSDVAQQDGRGDSRLEFEARSGNRAFFARLDP